MTNWEFRLRQIASEHANMAGPTGDRLRATIAHHQISESVRAMQLAHCRAREAVITGVRMALRCGALLAEVQPAALESAARIACMSDIDVAGYLALAQSFPELAAICARRNGRIDEAQAMRVLDTAQSNAVASLIALAGGHYVSS